MLRRFQNNGKTIGNLYFLICTAMRHFGWFNVGAMVCFMYMFPFGLQPKVVYISLTGMAWYQTYAVNKHGSDSKVSLTPSKGLPNKMLMKPFEKLPDSVIVSDGKFWHGLGGALSQNNLSIPDWTIS
jgi:hypothetical protein